MEPGDGVVGEALLYFVGVDIEGVLSSDFDFAKHSVCCHDCTGPGLGGDTPVGGIGRGGVVARPHGA